MKLNNLIAVACAFNSIASAQVAQNNSITESKINLPSAHQIYGTQLKTIPEKKISTDHAMRFDNSSLQIPIQKLRSSSQKSLKAGGQDGSGGDFLKAKKELVLWFLQQAAHSTFATTLDRIRYSMREDAILPIKDKKAKQTLEKILKLPQVKNFNFMIPGADNKGTIQLIVNQDSECIDSFTGEKKAAALLKSDPDSAIQICMSLKKLMEFPDDVFVTYKRDHFDDGHRSYEIAGLVFHELAHAAGFDEEDANYIQDYLLRDFLLHCTMNIELDMNESTPYDDATIRIGLDDTGRSVNIQRFYPSPRKGPQVSVEAFNTSDILNEYKFSPEDGFMTLEIGNRDSSVSVVNFKWVLREVNTLEGNLTATGRLDGKSFTSKGRIEVYGGCFSR